MPDFFLCYLRHVVSDAFDILRLFADEMLVHGLGEKRFPALKFFRTHVGFLAQAEMGEQRISPVAPRLEKHCLPEVIHLWQVWSPIKLGDVVKDETEKEILPGFFVEGINKHLDIIAT
jgi:hypothetical protein